MGFPSHDFSTSSVHYYKLYGIPMKEVQNMANTHMDTTPHDFQQVNGGF